MSDENHCADCGHPEANHAKSEPKACISRLPTVAYERKPYRYCPCRAFRDRPR
jgi:hypothetical protein